MSANISIRDICDAIRDTLGTAAILVTSQSADELTESIPDTPLLQVYPEEDTGDTTSNNDRTTFSGGVKQKDLIIHADFYATRRRHLGEDFDILIQGWDQFRGILESIQNKPYFGLAGIKAFHWNAKRTIFQYDDPKFSYVGVRFIFTIRLF